MHKKKDKNKSSSEQLAKIERLRKMAKSSLSIKLDELKEILCLYPKGMPIEDIARKIGTNEQGVLDILASTHNSTIEKYTIKVRDQETWCIRIKNAK